MVDSPAERDRPGFVRKLGAMRLRSPSGAQGHAFIELFAGGDVEAAVTDDFTTVIWRKLCGNCAGIISALLLQPSDIAHDESIAEAIRSLVRECVAVGRAEGAKLDDGVVEAVVQGYRGAQIVPSGSIVGTVFKLYRPARRAAAAPRVVTDS